MRQDDSKNRLLRSFYQNLHILTVPVINGCALSPPSRRWQLKAVSQNSVSSGTAATLAGERSSRKSLRPGMTERGMAKPTAPAHTLKRSMSGSVTHDSLPIHWSGGGRSRSSSSSRMRMSPEARKATTTRAVELEGDSVCIVMLTWYRPTTFNNKSFKTKCMFCWCHLDRYV